jgi:hypothetical protein
MRRLSRSSAGEVAPTLRRRTGGRGGPGSSDAVAWTATALVHGDATSMCGGGFNARRLRPSPIFTTSSTPWREGEAVAPVPRTSAHPARRWRRAPQPDFHTEER